MKTIERSNSSMVLKEVGPLLPVAIDAFQGSRPSPQAMLDFLKVIPNIRSLKSTDLIQLFEIITNALDEAASTPNIQAAMNQKAKLLKETESILMLAASNLETVRLLRFSSNLKEKGPSSGGKSEIKDIMKQLSSHPDASVQSLNDKIEAEERRNIRMILNLYFDLYENDPEFFAGLRGRQEDSSRKKYAFQPLSGLMAEELMDLSHQKVLVS